MKILIAEPDRFSPAAVSLLESLGEVEQRGIVQSEMAMALRQYDLIWIRLGLQIRATDISAEKLPVRCQYIVTATTGVDHVDARVLSNESISLLSLRGHEDFLETVQVTAEHTLGLLLALARKLPAACLSVENGVWDRDQFRGVELYGKTVGIIGYGRLGRAMAQYVSAMNMNVIAFDPYVELPSDSKHVQADSLRQLLSESDVISIHVKLTDETERMLGEGEFNAMKPSVLLVNTSRGDVLDESALLHALLSGRIAGAALDVLVGEPSISSDDPLVRYAASHANLLITPHIGGAAAGVMERCEHYLAGVVRDQLEGRPH